MYHVQWIPENPNFEWVALTHAYQKMHVTFTTVITSPSGPVFSRTSTCSVKGLISVSLSFSDSTEMKWYRRLRLHSDHSVFFHRTSFTLIPFVFFNYIQVNPFPFHAPYQKTRIGHREVISDARYQQNAVPAFHICLQFNRVCVARFNAKSLNSILIYRVNKCNVSSAVEITETVKDMARKEPEGSHLQWNLGVAENARFWVVGTEQMRPVLKTALFLHCLSAEAGRIYDVFYHVSVWKRCSFSFSNAGTYIQPIMTDLKKKRRGRLASTQKLPSSLTSLMFSMQLVMWRVCDQKNLLKFQPPTKLS